MHIANAKRTRSIEILSRDRIKYYDKKFDSYDRRYNGRKWWRIEVILDFYKGNWERESIQARDD